MTLIDRKLNRWVASQALNPYPADSSIGMLFMPPIDSFNYDFWNSATVWTKWPTDFETLFSIGAVPVNSVSQWYVKEWVRTWPEWVNGFTAAGGGTNTTYEWGRYRDLWDVQTFSFGFTDGWAWPWTADVSINVVSEESLQAWFTLWNTARLWLFYSINSGNSTIDVTNLTFTAIVQKITTWWALTTISTISTTPYTQLGIATNLTDQTAYEFVTGTTTPVVSVAWDRIMITYKITGTVETTIAGWWFTNRISLRLWNLGSMRSSADSSWCRPVEISIT